MHWLVRMGRDAIKEAGIISLANIPIALVSAFILRVGVFFTEGWLLLLEAAALVVIGGVMGLFAGSPWGPGGGAGAGRDNEGTRQDFGQSLKRASAHTVAGVLIFAEGLLLGLLATS